MLLTKQRDKASSFVKEKEIDKKAMKSRENCRKGIKIAGNKIGEVAGEIVAGYKSKAGRYFFYRQHSTRYHCRCQRY